MNLEKAVPVAVALAEGDQREAGRICQAFQDAIDEFNAAGIHGKLPSPRGPNPGPIMMP